MIEFVQGNIFNSDCEAIVNTVNCVGIMGKGLALQFKKRYPEMFTAYKTACNNNEVKIGKIWTWKTPEKLIFNFPTKNHWKNPSKYEYIQSGLQDLISVVKQESIKSCAVPALGCQNGGLDWIIVKNMIKLELAWNDTKFVVYNPGL